MSFLPETAEIEEAVAEAKAKAAPLKVFGIANETHECYGHGDYGNELRICATGDYGSGKFPPLFKSRQAAQMWIDEHKDAMVRRVVELELRNQ